MTTAWGSGAWGENTWGGQQSAISGVTASGAAGTAGVNVTVALTGVGGTGAVGSVTGEVFYFAAITGVQTDGAVGSVAVAERQFALTGVDAVGYAGALEIPGRAAQLIGVGATGEVGSVTGSAAGFTDQTTEIGVSVGDATPPNVSNAQARPDLYVDTGEWDNDNQIFFTFQASDNVGVDRCYAELNDSSPDEPVSDLAGRRDSDTG